MSAADWTRQNPDCWQHVAGWMVSRMHNPGPWSVFTPDGELLMEDGRHVTWRTSGGAMDHVDAVVECQQLLRQLRDKGGKHG